MSTAAKATIDRIASEGNQVGVSTISLVEVVYLAEKARVLPTANEDLLHTLLDAGHAFTEVPVTAFVVAALRLVPRSDVPDMPDRIIAATGLHLGVPTISRDGRIRTSSLQTIW